MTTPSLARRLMPLVLFGWVVGGLRLALDFLAPEQASFVGLYYFMPLGIAWVGLRRGWGAVRWTQVAVTMVALAFLTWFVCNSIAYSVGQFEGWTSGRYATGMEIAETANGKIAAGVSTGFFTAVFGSVWCVIWGTLLIWLPGRCCPKPE